MNGTVWNVAYRRSHGDGVHWNRDLGAGVGGGQHGGPKEILRIADFEGISGCQSDSAEVRFHTGGLIPVVNRDMSSPGFVAIGAHENFRSGGSLSQQEGILGMAGRAEVPKFAEQGIVAETGNGALVEGQSDTAGNQIVVLQDQIRAALASAVGADVVVAAMIPTGRVISKVAFQHGIVGHHAAADKEVARIVTRHHPGIEDDVSFQVKIVQLGRRASIDLQPDLEHIENDVVDQVLGAGAVLHVGAVPVAAVRCIPAVVVHDVPVELVVAGVLPGSQPGGGVVNDVVDDLDVRRKDRNSSRLQNVAGSRSGLSRPPDGPAVQDLQVAKHHPGSGDL